MKIVLDRRSCNCWEAAFETHFGWHFLRDEITPVGCTVEIADDGKEEIAFLIKDRDTVDKILDVGESDRADAYDSWLNAWQKQQKESGR
jgi:hypothetical protein